MKPTEFDKWWIEELCESDDPMMDEFDKLDLHQRAIVAWVAKKAFTSGAAGKTPEGTGKV